ncbi:MAG TPA: 5'-3' exonuclease H3TH domain-containing protein [Candidatus Paceibacterota bacterium]|nr:5'-3' exonuclease H3TH domain-containing protein [Candidatus Paceibacterota bacterium]
MKRLLLIDANSIIHRSFHALPPFTTPEGKPSGAIYGIASILLKLWREERPDYAAALFDRPEPTFRDEKYAEYKAQRPPTADELITQIIEAHKLFDAFGIKTFECVGYEADDLIATLAEKFKALPDVQVVILTGDRDTLQMVEGDKLVVQTFNKGVSDTTVYNEAAVIEKYGIAPRQMVDYKALVGDSSDNIKGVPGVGPKTALELIKRFGTVKEMYRQLDGESPGADEDASLKKLREKFGAFKKEAELSEMLVTLERHAPIEIPAIEDLVPFKDTSAAAVYFEKMGFATLLKRILMPAGEENSATSTKARAKSKPRDSQASLF